MSAKTFTTKVPKGWNKDQWILQALRANALHVAEDGTIYRRKFSKSKNLGPDGRRQWRLEKVKPSLHKATGRVYFNLIFDGIRKSVSVPRVVALALIPNPDNLPEVNHIDGNKENNHPSNLEWASGPDNRAHALKTGLKSQRGSQNANVKLTADQVLAIRKMGENASPAAVARRFGVAVSTVKNILERRTWQHI